MKSRMLSKWSVGLVVCGLALTGGCLEEKAGPPAVSVADTEAVPPVQPTAPVVEEGAAVPSPGAEADIASAPVTPVPLPKTIPANIKPSAATAEVIKLANSGVGESVMLTFVTNSASTFNLGADDIIYLNDIGVPGAVVTAMIQRDQALKGTNTSLAVFPAAAPPPPAPVAPQQEPLPPPSEAVSAPLTPPEGMEPTAAPEDFYTSLAPYGTWVEVAGYGRCWQPTAVVVNPGWQPYFDCGHWVYTDAGWYWLSDYSWGWAPFHYGRWFRHAGMGWCWAPDHVWGPSWVCWRDNDAYCGWAPLPPGCSFSIGFGLSWHGRHVRDWDDCGLGRDHFRFVAWNDFHHRELRGHALPPHQVDQVFNKTVVVNKIIVNNKTVINQGIAPERVAKVTHQEVRPVSLHQVSGGRPVNGRAENFDRNLRALSVYRPQIAPATHSQTQAAGRPGTVAVSHTQPGAADRSTVISGASRPVTAPSAANTRTGTASSPTRTTIAEPSVNRAGATAGTSHSLPGTTAGSRTLPRTEAPAVTSSHEQPPAGTPAPGLPTTTPARPQPAQGRTAPAPVARSPWTAQANSAQPAQPAQPARSATPWFGQTAQSPAAPPRTQATAPNSASHQIPPWMQNRTAANAPSAAPAPQAPTARPYSPPAANYTAPTYTPPARTYTPPAYAAPAPSREVPRQQYVESRPAPAPSRPAYSEAPHYSAPAPAPSRPAPAPASPPANSGGNNRNSGNSGNGRR